MILVTDLVKQYPSNAGMRTILDGITLTVRPGDRVGILGRNGAGKSTLIRLIAGAEPPTSGTVERLMSVSWPLAFTGGFHGRLTGLDNLRFICRIYGVDFHDRLAFVEEFTELGSYLREPVMTYSSGMRARLAFAISMTIDFDCYLVDEVMAVGDESFRERCQYELFEKRKDKTMVMVSHSRGYLQSNCNRFLLLREGKILEYEDPDEAYWDYKRMLIGPKALEERARAKAKGARLTQEEPIINDDI
ncbi:ABC transporter ATP-binding protein [Novosphingobium olei]|uniref:ABC transporter ATP-binding protein n=1 Tax=Novosphingobium olei TaxID=2728851 RepID=UPI003091E654|nr:ABC transporter ATP-binding protein [Novosphingobium olei]